MGHNVLLVDQQFVIRAERTPAALAAVQDTIRADSITIQIDVGDGPAISGPFRFSNEQDMLAASTLEELLNACGFYPLYADAVASAGDIVGLELDSEFEYTEEYELFKLIAPFVEPGYLELRSDDDSGSEHWRYNFNGTRCFSVSPWHIWPPYHPEDQPGGEACLIVPARYLRLFLETLWMDLSDVSTITDGAPGPQGESAEPCLAEAFYIWRKGTPLSQIRRWFDEQNASTGDLDPLMQTPG